MTVEPHDWMGLHRQNVLVGKKLLPEELKHLVVS